MRRMFLRSLSAALLVVPAVLVGMPATASSAECEATTFDGFSAADDERLQRNNAAAYTADGRLRVTPEALSQSGSVFTKSTITLAGDASFSTAFSFQFTTSGGGADGLVFVVQTESNTVGTFGGGIGYQGIENSVGVEFDNWHNGGVDPDEEPARTSHVGIDVDGSIDSIATAAVVPNLDNGGVFYAWVDYDGATQILEVRVSQADVRPEDPILAEQLNLPDILGSTEAYLGFTSATGGSAANHDVLTWTFTNCYAPLGESGPPTVDAGADARGEEGDAIALDGTVTDPDPEETLTTVWAAEEGAPCTFSDPAAVDTTVTCTEAGTYTLTLTADDGVNAPVSDTTTVTVEVADVFDPIGYRMIAADGGVFTFGDRDFHGSLGDRPLNRAIVGGADDPATFEGYWLVASDGGVFAFGSAGFFGSLAEEDLSAPVVEIEPTPTGKGYWLVSASGQVHPFGDARHHGDMLTRSLNQPVIGMSATSTGLGYWLVAKDGGIFAFGDAKFLGSMGDTPLNAPVDDLAPTGDDSGYYLVARDGGVFAFGNAPFHGSTGSMTLNKPVIALLAHPDGTGYWLAATDGGVFTFGSVPFFGSMGNVPLSSPVNDLIH